MMLPRTHLPLRAAAVGALLALVGCGTADAGPARARKVHVTAGFSFPESVRYDPEQDVYFVSNIQGFGSVKDGQGYISRVVGDDLGRVTHFVRSGRDGATLHAPKGMALQGDTLWVADIDVLRGFHRRTGAPVGVVDLRPHRPVMLNDVALGPDGSVYVTDTGIIMSNVGVLFERGAKIFRVGPGRSVSVIAREPAVEHPNGITWDPVGKRWIVVSFDPFDSEAYVLGTGSTPRTVLARGPGRFDGVEVLADGRLLVTSWSDSSLHVIHDGRDERVVRNLWQPADLGVDTRRQRVAIPLVLQGLVEFWELPPL